MLRESATSEETVLNPKCFMPSGVPVPGGPDFRGKEEDQAQGAEKNRENLSKKEVSGPVRQPPPSGKMALPK